MAGLAGFAIRTPLNGALLAAGGLAGSMVLPPLVWLSNGAVALWWLRFGPRGAAPMLAVSLLGACGLFALLGLPLLGVVSAAVFWLPTAVGASVLRRSVSLELAVLSAAAVALLAGVLGHAQLGDVGAALAEALAANPALVQGLAPGGAAELGRVLTALAPAMLVCGVLINTVAGLFVGRWWQARLFHPGGFGEAFRCFRLGRATCTGLAALGLTGLFSAAPWGYALAAVAVLLLLLQGLAVAHALVQARGWPGAALFALYLALLVPHAVLLLAVLGAVDAWLDIRSRAAPARDDHD